MESYLKFCAKQNNMFLELIKEDYSNKFNFENRKKLFNFCMKSIMGWEYNFIFEWLQIQNTKMYPFFIKQGAKSTSEEIQKYIKYYTKSEKGRIDKDNLNEMNTVKNYIDTLKYKGNVMCFLGSTTLWGERTTAKAEFDGIIFMPNRLDGVFAVIIEAKNTANGYTEAKRQLTKRLDEYLLDHCTYEFKDIGNKGAAAEISMAQTLGDVK